ncbi:MULTISPECIES: VanZ family protein [unclassified Bacillus (in: firmicutes)]|uniref:VanZ family protein n=1 Tax=unclassified Bacillus (in: firmicutes) TaxID=185979 RepID=UPI0008EABDB9|nr:MULTISPECIES: VanZ family protein [unclassified Bacillus (in: firmicutes)]SFB04815.1 VanZ like family protein [Bacillus sp. UNCCL13]SFQ88387.1 VanZ like family protein [Bacillus sp. cl95]
MYLINGSLFILLGTISYLVGRGIIVGTRFKNRVSVYWLKEVIHFLFVLYICLLISVTLFPFPIGFQSNIENVFRSLNVIPLKTIINDISQIGIAYDGDVLFMLGLIARNVGGNILLLMPLGFLAPILWNKFKYYKNTVLLGFIVSISIEVLQFLESLIAGERGRVTDIDDVICNVLGALLGYLIYISARPIVKRMESQYLDA